MKTLAITLAALCLIAPCYAETTAEKLKRLAELEWEISMHLTAIRGKKEGGRADQVQNRHKVAITLGTTRQDSLRVRRLELAARFEQRSDASALLAEEWHKTYGKDVRGDK